MRKGVSRGSCGLREVYSLTFKEETPSISRVLLFKFLLSVTSRDVPSGSGESLLKVVRVKYVSLEGLVNWYLSVSF